MDQLKMRLTIISERLNDAVKVAYEAPGIGDQGYPYATGYSRSAMMGAVEELTSIISDINNNK